jgi:hypothetical protein
MIVGPTVPQRASGRWLIALRRHHGRGTIAHTSASACLSACPGTLPIDEKGEAIEAPAAKIGVLYIRKSAFPRGSAWPEELRVTVDAVETTRLN